ncbi:MAG: phosphate transport system regulatory protein PhoU [Blastochloris sp.]|nr:phosphate transport system regulatory protein PhoU [Blastochloris sp.]
MPSCYNWYAVEESMARAIRSLHTHNTAVALWVINNDNYIDEARDTLETRVVTLLATQQPIVAGDLRLLMVTTAIANELERIADYASGIAGRFYRRPELMAQFTLPEQFLSYAEQVRHSIHLSLQAFLAVDEQIARNVIARDIQIDAMHDELHSALVTAARTAPEQLDIVIDLIDTSNVLERAADPCW